ncbi:MAG: ABC transporter permease [Treponema sp.]|jgi:simple sugar transport system permease protein|nr:ABC transporter permease [Treponema sp.]
MKRRKTIYRGMTLGALIPLSAALLIPVVFILTMAENPLKSMAVFFTGPWSSAWFFGNTLDGMALLLTASLGAAFAFRGGCFNLGGEGQIYLGGCAAAAILLLTPEALAGPAALTLAASAALLAGGIMGGFSGLLRRTTGANELITSFLLSAALIPLGDYLISGPLRNPQGNLLGTEKFSSSRLLPRLLPPSALSVSFILAVILVLAGHIFLNRTALGYRFRICGAIPSLALFGGINPEKSWIPGMAVSGALAGLTGFFAAAGTYGMTYQGFSGGLGWTAIAAALIAGNEPLALLQAVFFLGWLKAGSDSALLQAGFGFETASLIQAAALFLAALPFGSRYLAGRRR